MFGSEARDFRTMWAKRHSFQCCPLPPPVELCPYTQPLSKFWEHVTYRIVPAAGHLDEVRRKLAFPQTTLEFERSWKFVALCLIGGGFVV